MAASFIARQPIFDKRLHVYGYELLFRSGPENLFRPSPVTSPAVIADSITLFDLQTLTGNTRAFINADELALRLGAPRLIPPERLVVEILENVRATDEIVAICRELHADGYVLALDDFVDSPESAPFVDVVDFLKVDFRLLDEAGRASIAKKYGGNNISLLAEKVETEEELADARCLGYNYFQGYFFCRPSMIRSGTIPGNKLIYLELLNAVAPVELDYARIEEILKREPSLLYRLLRYMNSPLLGLRAEIHSIRHALALLGEQEFRRWVSIFAIIAMAKGKPPELVRTALTRAYFCEEFAAPAHLVDKRPGLFLMGLLSVTDALLDKPMAEILSGLPIAKEVKDALVGGDNRLHDVYELLLALEHAEWPNLDTYAGRLGCAEENIPLVYEHALQKALAVGV
jgi:c-di-GMP-related signal transduction protein